jgi:ABC-2 type transport system ATP-binding protein
MTAGKPIIEVDNVTCRFGAVTAVEGVSLAIGEGTLFGLVGSDGAGKSTLLRAMATMIRPDSGRVAMAGFDTVRERRQVKRLIGTCPSGSNSTRTSRWTKTSVLHGHQRHPGP